MDMLNNQRVNQQNSSKFYLASLQVDFIEIMFQVDYQDVWTGKKIGLAQLSGTISGAQSRWLFGASSNDSVGNTTKM